jgi:hypothetical protein
MNGRMVLLLFVALVWYSARVGVDMRYGRFGSMLKLVVTSKLRENVKSPIHHIMQYEQQA